MAVTSRCTKSKVNLRLALCGDAVKSFVASLFNQNALLMEISPSVSSFEYTDLWGTSECDWITASANHKQNSPQHVVFFQHMPVLPSIHSLQYWDTGCEVPNVTKVRRLKLAGAIRCSSRQCGAIPVFVLTSDQHAFVRFSKLQ